MGVKMGSLSSRSRVNLLNSAIRLNLAKSADRTDLLAKEKVASSNLVFRSKHEIGVRADFLSAGQRSP